MLPLSLQAEPDLKKAVLQSVSSLPADQKKSVLVIDLNSFAYDEGAIESFFDENGLLNAHGHLFTADVLCSLLAGRKTGLSSLQLQKRFTVSLPFRSLEYTVVPHTGSLEIKDLPAGKLTAVLHLDQSEIRRTFYGGRTVFQNIPDHMPFQVYVESEQERFCKYAGVTGSSKKACPAGKLQQKNAAQQKLAGICRSFAPARWLFLGDSITHGAKHTLGYDSAVNLFEKFIHDDLGRKEDVIINTGVSGATVFENFENLALRLHRYLPADAAVIMFGTNDCVTRGMDVQTFGKYLENLIDELQNQNVQVILRTPPDACSHPARHAALGAYVNEIRRLAAQKGCLLADHYDLWQKITASDASAAAGTGHLLFLHNDPVHPGFRGQLWMFLQLLSTMALANDSTMMPSLEYPAEVPEISLAAGPKFMLHEDDGHNLYLTVMADSIEKLLQEKAGGAEIKVMQDHTVYMKTAVCRPQENLEDIVICALEPKTSEIRIEARIWKASGADTVYKTVPADLQLKF